MPYYTVTTQRVSVERWDHVQAPSRQALEEDIYDTGGEEYIKGEDPDHTDGHSFDIVDITRVAKPKPTLEIIITREVLAENADEYDEYEAERKGQE